MNNIGIYDSATATYREVTIKDGEVVISLKPAYRYDAGAGAWVAEIADPTRIGLMGETGEYREIDYGADEVIVPLRPSPDHQWQNGDWAYVEPPAPTPADFPLNRIQFEAVLEIAGYSVDQLADTITAMPLTDMEKAIAKSRLRNAQEFYYTNPLVQGVRAAIGMAEEELAALWMQAKDVAI